MLTGFRVSEHAVLYLIGAEIGADRVLLEPYYRPARSSRGLFEMYLRKHFNHVAI